MTKTAAQASTASIASPVPGPRTVACAILLDTLRRVRACGDRGMWGVELSWHLRPWGADAYDNVLKGRLNQKLRVDEHGVLGPLLFPTPETSAYIAELEAVPGVAALVASTSGPLPDPNERGGRITAACASALSLLRAELPADGSPAPRGAAEQSQCLEPIAELLRPLFGNMLMGKVYSPSGNQWVGLAFYRNEGDFPCGPFGGLQVKIDTVAGTVSFAADSGEDAEWMLGDDNLTLGDLERLCRIGGWASLTWPKAAEQPEARSQPTQAGNGQGSRRPRI